MAKTIFKLSAMDRINSEFFDSRRCDRWLVEELHPGGSYRCPRCAEKVPVVSIDQFLSGRIVQCRVCSKQYSHRSETPASGCHLSAAEIFMLALLHEIKMPLPAIAIKLGRDRGTVGQVIRRFTIPGEGP